MISQEIIDIINKESETIIIEWTENSCSVGHHIIEEQLYNHFIKTGKLEEKQLKLLKNSIRNLFIQDMIIMEW